MAEISEINENALIACVKSRLESFGYIPKYEDYLAIYFAINKVESHIKNSCNLDTIPQGLHSIAVDMACGEFLRAKEQTGNLGEFDLESAVKQVQIGDTSVTFSDALSAESKLDSLINLLITKGEGDFACYRKIKW